MTWTPADIGQFEAVVFLDIDGVLNGHNYSEKAESCFVERRCVNEFNALLEEENAAYVVSSSWRYMVVGGAMALSGFEYLLRTHGVMSGRLLGITCADEEIPKRSAQIRDWIERHGYGRPFVVLDDLAISNVPLVRTQGNIGLTWMHRIQASLLLRVQKRTSRLK